MRGSVEIAQLQSTLINLLYVDSNYTLFGLSFQYNCKMVLNALIELHEETLSIFALEILIIFQTLLSKTALIQPFILFIPRWLHSCNNAFIWYYFLTCTSFGMTYSSEQS
jgi:hypothetical protein